LRGAAIKFACEVYLIRVQSKPATASAASAKRTSIVVATPNAALQLPVFIRRRLPPKVPEPNHSLAQEHFMLTKQAFLFSALALAACASFADDITR
jgi:hypothetical protein